MNTLKKLYGLIECCLNWRVIVGLAGAGVVLLIFAPSLAVISLPVLVALVCPISMLVMWVSMSRMNMEGRNALRSEPLPTLQNLDRQQQLQLLEERLDRVRAQQREIARQLPALERVHAHAPIAAVVGSNGEVDSQVAVS